MNDEEISSKLNTIVRMWQPQAMEQFIGTFRYEERRTSQHGETTVLVFEIDGGELLGVWENVILADALKDVQPGDRIGIKFLGKQTNKRNTQYNAYHVVRG